MKPLIHLFHLSTGGVLAEEDQTPARRAQLGILAIATSLAMAAIWGVAAGSSVPALAAHNAYKLPLMLVLAAIGAVPVGMLAWKIVGVRQKARELLHGYALSVFLGCAVLLVLAPLVALYYLSSTAAGPLFAMGTVLLGLLVGCATFVRVVRARLREGEREEGSDWRPVVPGVVLMLAFVATLWQVVALFAPILPESTPFRGGIDDALVQP
ncbi:hypothetical protein [Sandaracinus amylolyticus]|uniref:Uncharacterized protein n=1 Tax=Sandaracinus amylolyticus TaxID=927083 RepID=A0A0F6YFS6_9BACT|nr:hypothetical protein [Sandaracinus amylolyticus]AKF03045.1 hypothetical protein DB32_000194 [Sandaracinus amylolyticus]